MNANDKKSGYEDKKSMLMGMTSRSLFLIWFPDIESM